MDVMPDVAILDVLDAAPRPMTARDVRVALGSTRPDPATVGEALERLIATKEVVRRLRPGTGTAVYSTVTSGDSE